MTTPRRTPSPRTPTARRSGTRRTGSQTAPDQRHARELGAVRPPAPREEAGRVSGPVPVAMELDAMPDRLRDLSDEERGLVSGYLHQLQLDLELGHWELTIDWEEQCEEDCDAQVSTVEGRYTAVLWLHDRFFTLSRPEQRRVLVHELLHMHTAGVMTASRLGMKNLTKDTKSWVMAFVRDAEEHAVDALSRVVGTHLPLPPWGEPDARR